MLQRVIEFLRTIGLQVTERPSVTGFIPGVCIVDGALLVDTAMTTPSNLLHEAGHLATIPGAYRSAIQTDVSEGVGAMLDDLRSRDLHPDHPLNRAALHCSDVEATAWAYAAGIHLGLPAEKIIEDQDYDGDGASVRSMLHMGQYFGIHGLAHAGFCAVNDRVAKYTGLPAYPTIAMWLQHEDFGNSLQSTKAA